MLTTDEHRLCLAMLRGALGISSAECDDLLQRTSGWCEAWEAGLEPAIRLAEWQGHVAAIAHWYASGVIANAEPVVLEQMARLMLHHASRARMDRAWLDGSENADLLEE